MKCNLFRICYTINHDQHVVRSQQYELYNKSCITILVATGEKSAETVQNGYVSLSRLSPQSSKSLNGHSSRVTRSKYDS